MFSYPLELYLITTVQSELQHMTSILGKLCFPVNQGMRGENATLCNLDFGLLKMPNNQQYTDIDNQFTCV